MRPEDIPMTRALIDRASARRTDELWVLSLGELPTTRYLACCGGRCLYLEGPRLKLFAPGELEGSLADNAEKVFLGLYKGRAHFALILPDDAGTEGFSDYGELIDLRRACTLLDGLECELATVTTAIARWRDTHRFCARCGAPLGPVEGGNVLKCADEGCGRLSFPRTDAAAIVLVEWEDKVLLARQAGWPEAMYSCLAGFVDPGESLENTVAREVFEEAGVHIERPRYLGSQPWPFPSSLMLGFRALARSGELQVDNVELEDARWFTREELKCKLDAGELTLPGKLSISRWLIDGWFGEGG